MVHIVQLAIETHLVTGSTRRVRVALESQQHILKSGLITKLAFDALARRVN